MQKIYEKGRLHGTLITAFAVGLAFLFGFTYKCSHSKLEQKAQDEITAPFDTIKVDKTNQEAAYDSSKYFYDNRYNKEYSLEEIESIIKETFNRLDSVKYVPQPQ